MTITLNQLKGYGRTFPNIFKQRHNQSRTSLVTLKSSFLGRLRYIETMSDGGEEVCRR